MPSVNLKNSFGKGAMLGAGIGAIIGGYLGYNFGEYINHDVLKNTSTLVRIATDSLATLVMSTTCILAGGYFGISKDAERSSRTYSHSR